MLAPLGDLRRTYPRTCTALRARGILEGSFCWGVRLEPVCRSVSWLREILALGTPLLRRRGIPWRAWKVRAVLGRTPIHRYRIFEGVLFGRFRCCTIIISALAIILVVLLCYILGQHFGVNVGTLVGICRVHLDSVVVLKLRRRRRIISPYARTNRIERTCPHQYLRRSPFWHCSR